MTKYYFCFFFGHELEVVDDIGVDKDGNLCQYDRGHLMCKKCRAVNWQEERYPAPGMWYDRTI